MRSSYEKRFFGELGSVVESTAKMRYNEYKSDAKEVGFMREVEKIRIIYDTDMDTDCDDAGALAILYEYAKQGKAEVLGVIADVITPWAAPCCQVLADYYGFSHPIGTIYEADHPEGASDRFTPYRKHVLAAPDRRYNRRYAEQLRKRDTDYPPAVQVYRQLLATAPAHSVTIVCVGMLTALADLLQSPADGISPLSGMELVREKVDRVVDMGDPGKAKSFNWDMDAPAAQIVMEYCPVPIYFSSSGTTIVSGHTLSTKLPADHPVRQIYETFTRGPGLGRSSWDLIALLYALEPENPMLQAVFRGTCRYDAEAKCSRWVPDGGRMDREILLTCTDGEMADYLEVRMTGEF